MTNQWDITSGRINAIAKKFGYTRYLEIGVEKGNTFFNVEIPYKTAVDPNFQFNFSEKESPGTKFYPITSDKFFLDFEVERRNPPYTESGSVPFVFDIILIDGLHTFEQSYHDFINSIKYSHEKTIWILDDTIPSDPWSSIPDQQKSLLYRKMADIIGIPWHGDVFKTIFAIHEYHTNFCYATQMNYGNPQTIIWKTPEQRRQKIFKNYDEISRLNYFDMLDMAYIFFPVKEDIVEKSLIFTEINPDYYKNAFDYKNLLYWSLKIKNNNERIHSLHI